MDNTLTLFYIHFAAPLGSLLIEKDPVELLVSNRGPIYSSGHWRSFGGFFFLFLSVIIESTAIPRVHGFIASPFTHETESP